MQTVRQRWAVLTFREVVWSEEGTSALAPGSQEPPGSQTAQVASIPVGHASRTVGCRQCTSDMAMLTASGGA